MGQKSTKPKIDRAIQQSAAGDDTWAGIDVRIGKERPQSILNRRREAEEEYGPELLEFSRLLHNAKGGANCGTGAGGFKPGNTCAGGGGLSDEEKKVVEQQWADEWIASLDGDEREAVEDYTLESDQINSQLRSGTLGGKIERTVVDLDAALEKSVTPHDITAYRGLKSDPKWKIGNVVEDLGYTSVAKGQHTAEDFADDFGSNSGGVVIEVRIPKGSLAAPIEKLSGSYGSEGEILIARDARFKVTGKRKDGDRTVYEGTIDASIVENTLWTTFNARSNCGTGAGGFKPGNTCAGGGGGATSREAEIAGLEKKIGKTKGSTKRQALMDQWTELKYGHLKKGSTPKASGKEMSGHPLAGKSGDDLQASLRRAYDPHGRGQAPAQADDHNPWKYDLKKFPAGVDGAKITRDVQAAVEQQKASNPFQRQTIAQVYEHAKKSQPSLTLFEFQSSLAKLQADEHIRLGPYTQALATLPDAEAKHLMPLDREFKYYVGAGRLTGNTWMPVNVFCRTGKGGGIDPHCSPGGSSGSAVASLVSKLSSGKAKSLTKKQKEELTTTLTRMTLKDLTGLKKELGVKASGVKAAQVERLATHLKTRIEAERAAARAKVAVKPTAKPAPTPPPVKVAPAPVVPTPKPALPPAPTAAGPYNFEKLSGQKPPAPPRLDAAEAKALQRYTAAAYRPLNEALRSGAKVPDDLADIDRGLSSLFNKVKDFPTLVIVRRGVNLTQAELRGLAETATQSLQSGNPITMKGYTSTTTVRGTFRGNTELRIAARRGLDVMRTGASDQVTAHEKEVLLNKDSRFRVVAVKQKGRNLTLHLEQLPDAGVSNAAVWNALVDPWNMLGERLDEDLEDSDRVRTAAEILVAMLGDEAAEIVTNTGWQPVANAFCRTGKGGGVDPTCSPGGTGGAEGQWPALTREAAEAYAKRFSVGKVSYRGIDLDIANSINESLTRIYESNPGAPKLYGIEGKKFNGQRGLLEAAPAAYAGGSGILYINTAIMGSQKKFAEYTKQSDEAAGYVRERLKKGDLTPEQKTKAEHLLSFERQIVDGSLNGIITHEFGHHVDYKRLMTKDGMDERQGPILKDWKEKAAKLSARATDNAHEYIAEAFVAHRKGMEIDPALKAAFQRHGF